MSNFSFLKSEFNALYPSAKQVESLALSDPRGSCFHARYTLELTIKWLYEHYPEREFHKRDLDNQNIDLNQKFDTILMIAIIEHLENPQRILCQIPKYLKTKGQLVITTPPPMGDRIHRIGARLGLFYQSAVEEHKIIFRRETLEPILELCGLQLDVFRKFLLGGNQLFICSQKPKESC